MRRNEEAPGGRTMATAPLRLVNHLGVQCAGHSAIPMLNKNCSGTYYIQLATAKPQNQNTFGKASLKGTHICICAHTHTHTHTGHTEKYPNTYQGDHSCYETHKNVPIHSAGDC